MMLKSMDSYSRSLGPGSFPSVSENFGGLLHTGGACAGTCGAQAARLPQQPGTPCSPALHPWEPLPHGQPMCGMAGKRGLARSPAREMTKKRQRVTEGSVHPSDPQLILGLLRWDRDTAISMLPLGGDSCLYPSLLHAVIKPGRAPVSKVRFHLAAFQNIHFLEHTHHSSTTCPLCCTGLGKTVPGCQGHLASAT